MRGWIGWDCEGCHVDSVNLLQGPAAGESDGVHLTPSPSPLELRVASYCHGDYQPIVIGLQLLFSLHPNFHLHTCRRLVRTNATVLARSERCRSAHSMFRRRRRLQTDDFSSAAIAVRGTTTQEW